MLDISNEKVAQVILLAREGTAGAAELDAFLDGLNEDEAASLVAIMWVGREAFGPDDLEAAKKAALEEATVPTAVYLGGTPHLAENLEAGLEALGVAVTDLEDSIR